MTERWYAAKNLGNKKVIRLLGQPKQGFETINDVMNWLLEHGCIEPENVEGEVFFKNWGDPWCAVSSTRNDPWEVHYMEEENHFDPGPAFDWVSVRRERDRMIQRKVMWFFVYCAVLGLVYAIAVLFLIWKERNWMSYSMASLPLVVALTCAYLMRKISRQP